MDIRSMSNVKQKNLLVPPPTHLLKSLGPLPCWTKDMDCTSASFTPHRTNFY